MKIGFVFDDSLDKTDGIQQYMFSLQKWLVAEGHDVHFLVGQTHRTDIPNVHSLSRNVGVRFNGNRLSMPLPASRHRLRKLLQTEQYDVLHVQVPYSPLLAGRIIKMANKRTAVIGTFHIAPYSKLVTVATRLLAIWSRRSVKRFNRIVSVSPAAQAFARQTFKVDTAVLPNVFDYDRFASAEPLAQYTDDTLTILFVGRLVNRKGCMQLLQAIAQLKTDGNKYPSFRVVVCGAGPLESELQTYVKNNKLESLVEFAGRISEADKPKYMASADISVFPSSGGESFGIVLIEAMASGNAAVLGGDNPGYRSVLGTQPDQLFGPRDVTELANKLRRLLTDKATRNSQAAWGAEASKQYDVAIVGTKLVDIYEQEFAQNSSSGA